MEPQLYSVLKDCSVL